MALAFEPLEPGIKREIGGRTLVGGVFLIGGAICMLLWAAVERGYHRTVMMFERNEIEIDIGLFGVATAGRCLPSPTTGNVYGEVCEELTKFFAELTAIRDFELYLCSPETSVGELVPNACYTIGRTRKASELTILVLIIAVTCQTYSFMAYTAFFMIAPNVAVRKSSIAASAMGAVFLLTGVAYYVIVSGTHLHMKGLVFNGKRYVPADPDLIDYDLSSGIACLAATGVVWLLLVAFLVRLMPHGTHKRYVVHQELSSLQETIRIFFRKRPRVDCYGNVIPFEAEQAPFSGNYIFKDTDEHSYEYIDEYTDGHDGHTDSHTAGQYTDRYTAGQATDSYTAGQYTDSYAAGQYTDGYTAGSNNRYTDRYRGDYNSSSGNMARPFEYNVGDVDDYGSTGYSPVPYAQAQPSAGVRNLSSSSRAACGKSHASSVPYRNF